MPASPAVQRRSQPSQGPALTVQLYPARRAGIRPGYAHSVTRLFRDARPSADTDPQLDRLPIGRYRPPFRSQFHQDVYGALRQRGFTVKPWFAVRDGHIDPVVIGDRGRLAVVCDGPRELTTPESLAADVDRELELRRCGWAFVHLRESDFRFDQAIALEPLWDQLRARGIDPAPIEPASNTTSP